jgi:hypothetical protein
MGEGLNLEAALERLNSPPAPPPTKTQKIVDFVSRYWAFAGVLAAIATAISGGITYFATRAELNRVECQMASNLLVVTLPNRIDLLQTKIQLANAKLERLSDSSSDAANEKNNIDDYRAEKKKANEQYDEALNKLKNHVCFNDPGSVKEPKP